MKKQITNLIKAFVLLVACIAITNSSNAQVWTIGGVNQERVVGQIPATAKSGFVNIAALRINVTGIGTTAGTNIPLTFNGFSCAITGTNPADITGAKMYFTTNSNPSISDILFSKGTISGSSLEFNGIREVKNLGNYFYWLMIDVAENAIIGNELQITAGSVTVNGVAYPITGILSTTTLINPNSALSGTYTVDATNTASGTNFTNFTALRNSINTNGIAEGGATFIFKDDQIFSVPNGDNAIFYFVNASSATKPVVFRKSGDGSNPPILEGQDGGATEDAIMQFVGWSNLTIDGLKFISGSSNTTPYSYGVLFRATGQKPCNNNLVINCKFDFSARPNFESPGNNYPTAIYFNARETTSELCVISNNTIANNTISGVPRGIALRGNGNSLFARATINKVYNNYLTDITATGIQFESAGSAFINDNVIENINLTGFANGELNFAGIKVENTFLECYVYNNKIRNISILSSANGRLQGLSLGQRNNSNIYVFNNLISNLQLPNVSNADAYLSRIVNIADNGSLAGGFYKFYNNTFVNESPATFAVIFTNGGHNNNAFEFKNNIIVVNTISGALPTTLGVLLGSKFGGSNQISASSSNNIYFSNNDNFRFVRTGSVPVNTVSGYNTFSQYKVSKSGELSSQFVNPNFVDLTSLKLDASNPGTNTITGFSITVPGLGLVNNLLDFDNLGFKRNSNTPTIGANEVLTLVSSIAVSGQGGASAITAKGASLQMEAIVSPSNATFSNYSWSVVNSLIASISGTGLLQAYGTGDGLVAVRATATDGSKVFGEAMITISGQVLVSGITVSSVESISVISIKGQNLQLSALVSPVNASNNTITWSVDNAAIASVSGTGLLSPFGDGIITATATANDGSAISNTYVVTLTNQIWISAINITAVGNTFAITTDKATLQLGAEILPGNASSKMFSWSASPADVGTISPSGLISSVGNGVLTVTATALDAGGLSTLQFVTISGQITFATSISVAATDNITNFTVRGGNLQFVETVAPFTTTNKSVSWSVMPSAFASINNSGLLTAIADGVVTITATSLGGSSVSGSALLTLSNQNPVTGIVITASGTSVLVNASLPLTALVSPANASKKTVTWTTEPSAVATISGAGTLRGLMSGVVTVTATSVDAPLVSAQYIVQVIQRVSTISVTGTGGVNTITVKAGMLQMIATVNPAGATDKTITWSVNNATVASINATGELMALANGSVTVRATANDGSGVQGTRVITISNQNTGVITLTSISLEGATAINVGEAAGLSVGYNPASLSTTGVSFTSSDETLATVTGEGLVTAIAEGIVTITATSLSNAGISASVVIAISGTNSTVGSLVPADFVVYPNPSSGTVNIRVTDLGSLYLYNSIGTLQSSQKILLKNSQLQLDKGLNILKFVTKKGTAIQKMVVE